MREDYKQYLEDSDELTPSEAAYRWGMKRNTLIAALNRGRFNEHLSNGEVRRFTQHGSTEWYLSVKAMRNVYGDEDRVQVFELSNLEGETLRPREGLFFEGHFIYITKPGEILDQELLLKLRECTDHYKARELMEQRV
ncbi:hypothetical protein J23TS9_05850 [Paenibacillus sp. J23TS9]|uniref:helix-turn-helix domain-containing protein n=1 Tax=Paenibacillus sp. J23TS9 TaxID=2807193 RepID=UPI001B1A3ABA|nr:helix-turn-helix domain-containing protein [Paenibacillus sp. J23TS9]GIP25455.1 hypothetical protein J23TS9_05850 [Paenibacillus sp. J23TS9]